MEDKASRRDVVIPTHVGEDGSMSVVSLSADGTMTVGTVLPVKEGESLAGREVVRLTPIEGTHAYEKETVYDGRPSGRAMARGPAMVNGPAFRAGWESLFERGQKAATLN